MKDLTYINRQAPDTGNWKARHFQALQSRVGIAGAVVNGIGAWIDYAECHSRRFKSPIGQDYVLGDHWAAWGFALRGLLNGETGELDCGTLDTILCDNLTEQGWDCDRERRKA